MSTHEVTTPGKPAPKRRQDLQGTNWLKEVPRPGIIAKYQGGKMGYVDRHNQFRQGYLHLAKFWKTSRWQTRMDSIRVVGSYHSGFFSCLSCTVNIVLCERGERGSQPFHRLHVFGAAFMK